MSNDEGGWAVFLLAAVTLAIAVMVACGCAREESPETPHADGMPLDAIEYDPPAWLDGCERCLMVTDRQTGQRWWILMMWGGSSRWMVLTDETLAEGGTR